MPISVQLAESSAEPGRYQRLVDAITDYAIYMLDPSGHVASWNRGAKRFKGYDEAEIRNSRSLKNRPHRQCYVPHKLMWHHPTECGRYLERDGVSNPRLGVRLFTGKAN